MTAELERQINAAMERTGGDVGQAACLLSMERSKLHNFIHNNKGLKLRWSTSKKDTPPPSQAVAIHRPAVMPVLPDAPDLLSDQEIAKALAAEDAAVRRGLTAMGIKDEALMMAVACQQFQNKHFARAIEILGGGIVKQFLDNLVEIDGITARLHGSCAETADLDGRMQMEITLRQDRAALQAINSKLFEQINKASLTQAIIKAKLSGSKPGERPAKPGFAPIIRAENVQINNHEAPADQPE